MTRRKLTYENGTLWYGKGQSIPLTVEQLERVIHLLEEHRLACGYRGLSIIPDITLTLDYDMMYLYTDLRNKGLSIIIDFSFKNPRYVLLELWDCLKAARTKLQLAS